MAATKPFTTAKEDETAPKLNNASIYRAGQNPNQPQNDSDDENDEDMITNSYFLAEQLKSQQRPTFVDALKHRRDASGRVITKSQVLHRRNNKKKQKSFKSESPPQSIKHINNNNNNNNNDSSQSIENDKHEKEDEQIKKDDDSSDESDDSDSDSSDDFDMNNLTVPKVENMENITTKNEADDVRQKFKQRLLLQKQEELQSAPIIVKSDKMDITIKDEDDSDDDDDDDDDDDESESEYETDSSSEDEEQQQRHPRNRKIMFLNKEQREEHYKTVNKPSLDEEAQILEQMEEERQEKLKQETTEDVLNYIRDQEKQEREGGDKSDDEMPDDNDDDFDGEEGRKEFELWKLREIKRNLRDEIIRSEREKEKFDLERRRKMTDDEIIRENKEMGLNKERKKGKPKFMQKYYHSGVFYRDGSIVSNTMLNRNFNAPTGQDKYIDFEKVPDAMRKKNFGKMSQSKWTHLANEDTTFDKEEREWFKKRNNMNDEERKKYERDRYQFRHKAHENNFWFKRGGNGANNNGSFDRPSYKKGNVDDGNKRFERKYKRYDRRDRSCSSERKSRKRRR